MSLEYGYKDLEMNDFQRDFFVVERHIDIKEKKREKWPPFRKAYWISYPAYFVSWQAFGAITGFDFSENLWIDVLLDSTLLVGLSFGTAIGYKVYKERNDP